MNRQVSFWLFVPFAFAMACTAMEDDGDGRPGTQAILESEGMVLVGQPDDPMATATPSALESSVGVIGVQDEADDALARPAETGKSAQLELEESEVRGPGDEITPYLDQTTLYDEELPADIGIDRSMLKADYSFTVGVSGDQTSRSSAVGDFNGDGKEDMAVGAPYAGLGDWGAVHVYFGTLPSKTFPTRLI